MRDVTRHRSRPSRRRPASSRARGPKLQAAGLVAPAPRAGRMGGALGGLGVAPTAAALAGDGQDATAPVSGDLAARDAADAPVLRLAGYEGPLDALLDQARAGRVDLQHLPLLAVVEQFVAALEAALRALRDAAGTVAGAAIPGPAPVPLQRLAEWVGMAAWLAWLRSRLLLPADDPDARAVRAEAEAFRRDLARRAAVRKVADWLDGLPQLGRDVFARGVALGEAHDDAERAAAELAALLGAYTRRIDPVPGQGRAADTYSPRPPRLWRVPDALAQMERLLGATSDLETISGGASLWRFLPDAECLATTGLASDIVPDPALLDRSAAASTLVASLELARQGQLRLQQGESFGAIGVHGISAVAPAGQDAETTLGTISAS